MKHNSGLNRYLSAVLLEALKAGYVNDLIIPPGEEFYYFKNFQKPYYFHELTFSPIPCDGSCATLYLVTAPDGLLGTWVDFWD